MKTIFLKRVSHMEKATFGVFIYKAIPFAVSLELPWRDNQINISCIPEGTYTLSKRDDRDAYEFHDVPGRTYIQLHLANLTAELEGCVAPGLSFEPFDGKIAVRGSKSAFRALESILDGEKNFRLKIIAPHRSEFIELP